MKLSGSLKVDKEQCGKNLKTATATDQVASHRRQQSLQKKKKPFKQAFTNKIMLLLINKGEN